MLKTIPLLWLNVWYQWHFSGACDAFARGNNRLIRVTLLHVPFNSAYNVSHTLAIHRMSSFISL